MNKKNKWGGRRKNQTGRPPVIRDATLRRRALWYYAADDEAELINKTLKIDSRREVLLQAVVAQQNGS